MSAANIVAAQLNVLRPVRILESPLRPLRPLAVNVRESVRVIESAIRFWVPELKRSINLLVANWFIVRVAWPKEVKES